MANSARIDELEKKFSENARRYFAPLANEYRKAGYLDRAIEICRAHLPQQPGHMSGHIVYGQALYESRQPDEAKAVFESALALDPENLIALRHLGDIARDERDIATARTWYLRVLDADPRNDEVSGMLAELDTMQAAAPQEAAPAEVAGGSTGWGDINPENASEAATEGEQAETVVELDVAEIVPEPDQGSDLLGSVEGERDADQAPSHAPAMVQAPPPPSLDRMLNDAFAPDADTLEMEVPTPDRPRPSSGSPVAPQDELDDDTFAEVDALFDEIAPSRGKTDESAGRVAGAASGSSGSDPSGDALFGDADPSTSDTDAGSSAPRLEGLETREFVAPSREPSTSGPRRDTGSMAVTGLTSFDQPTDEDSSTRAAFVTETMAELYLQQGFATEALDIYRQLVAQNPDDESLRDRVRQLEAGGRSSLSAAAVSSEVIAAAQQRQAVKPVRTVRSFFGRLAGRRAPAPSAHDTGADNGESGDEPVDDFGFPAGAGPGGGDNQPPGSIELDVIGGMFGDGSLNEEDERAASTLASGFSFVAMGGQQETVDPGSLSRPPVVTPSAGGRAAHAGGRELSLDQVFREPASRNPRKSGAYAFDQFFSDGTPRSSGAIPSAPAEGDDSPEGAEGDLEQFTAWLEGLKRK